MELLHELPPAGNEPFIRYQEPVVLLGSCFSTHMADYLRSAGFTVENNPAGVVFHPLALARFLTETLQQVAVDRSLQREDVFLSWDASSELHGMSQAALDETLSAARNRLRDQLRAARVLVVTVGSAHGYRLKATGEVVANCHRMPGALFEKELTPVGEMAVAWGAALETLKTWNPSLSVVFTVSPVRYSRDGWTENNRSKARLLELVGVLQKQFGVGYFPAYEAVNDLLRDYRYFAEDGVHPNAAAVAAVWELFRSWYMDVETRALTEEMQQLRQMQEHRLLFPESKAAADFQRRFHEKRESFLSLHPYICW